MSTPAATRFDVLDSADSSPDLSTPPKSPESLTIDSPAIRADQPSPSARHLAPSLSLGPAKVEDGDAAAGGSGGGDRVSASGATSTSAKGAAAPTTGPKPRGRKSAQNKDANIDGGKPEKERKPRKPRATSTSTTVPRKKQKVTDPGPEPVPAQQLQQPRQAKITDLVGQPQNQPTFRVASPAQTGNLEAIPKSEISQFLDVPTAPRTSGQNYDPIRSATIESQPTPRSFSPPQNAQASPRAANRASASPAIASLIDPPSVNVGSPNPSYFSTPAWSANSYKDAPPSIQSTSKILANEAPRTDSSLPLPDRPAPGTTKMEVERPSSANVEVCAPQPVATVKKSPAEQSTAPTSAAASPKPNRQKDAARPLPSGNGLLSSALFGGAAVANTVSGLDDGATIILEVPLNGEKNKYVNFAKLAEERYGFDALHPRLAAQRERMARVAAAGAAIEKGSGSGSGDEMSVDGSDMESNVEMGGMDVPGAGPSEGDKKPKKRGKKMEGYDKDDPFIDDSEMLWEEQAAASKDGFFVYCGPLVPAGEKPAIERADGTVKRGRGRGRGSRGGGGPGSRGGRGGGPGSRGGTTVRKPRVTKADKALMEKEKQEREKMALLASKPLIYPA